MEHADAAQRVGTVLDGRYRLERLLGAGAMGAVYVALASNGARCAVKLLLDPHFAGNRELLGRFVREGRVTTQLKSPHVIQVYELGVDAQTSTPFIVMELLDGSDVDGLITRVGPIHPTTAIRIAIQAARGLGAAHGEGVIHRDVKPANIFLHRQGGHDPAPSDSVVVKVADFGLAKALFADGDAMTSTGSALGSPLFMSPEQIKSAKHVGPRSDLWSLGMTLWTMLAGHAALENAQSIGELMVAVSTQPIPWLQDAAPWIDPQLALIVHSALLADVNARCPSTIAFADALAAFAGIEREGEPLTVADLLGVPTDLRSRVAPRAERATTWSESQPSNSGGEGDDSENVAEMKALIGQTLGGKYRLEGLLGHGGMGAVYRAASADGQQVAVKVVLEGERRRPEVLRRFVREAKTMTAIDSPYVVRVIDVDGDSTRGVPFIVMELLSGTDLDRLVRERGALEPAPMAKLFQQACEGLTAAHMRGIVHRDIKPANIFLHRDGSDRVTAKICDFGIAKQLQGDAGGGAGASTELTRTGGVIGSPSYMSPEQATSSKKIDHTTDIWSLGVALYEALCGKRPWAQCESVGDLMVAIITRPVPPLQDQAPWIDAGLAAVVDRALQKDPAQRHATMAAFAAALEPYARDAGELLVSTLTPVSAARRSSTSPRAPAMGGTITSSPAASASVPPQRRGGRRARPWIVGGALTLALAVAGFGAFVAMGSSGARTPPRPPAGAEIASTNREAATDTKSVRDDSMKAPIASASASALPAAMHASIKITPATAVVTVDGAPRALAAGGVLALEGEPGDSFDVVAKVGDRVVEKQVILRKDGKASVAVLDVPIAAKTSNAIPPATSAPTAHASATATTTASPIPSKGPVGVGVSTF